MTQKSRKVWNTVFLLKNRRKKKIKKCEWNMGK